MKISSIEVARAVAIFCIILTHTAPFLRTVDAHDGWYYLGHVIQQFNSFAVPFFFIVSGYFFSLGVDKYGLKKQINRFVPRILTLLLIWVFIDGLFWEQWLQEVIESGSLRPMLNNLLSIPGYALSRPDIFLFWGTAVPLWFLVSLAEGALILSALIALNLGKNSILLLGLVAYTFMLSASLYSDTLIGTGFTIPFQQRGIFISVFFLTIGYFTARSEIRIDGLKLLVASIILMFLESAFMSAHNNVLFEEHPYLFSTPLVSLAVLLLALQNPTFGANTILYRTGVISLGIYVIHTPIIGALDYFGNTTSHPVWELSYPFLVLLISIIIVTFLKKAPYLRKAVS